jgi:CRP/FNR family cyclic AMP-dependent transcriptional regulator
VDIRDVIDRATVLRDMPEEARTALAGGATVRHYRGGEYLWRVGDRQDSLLVVAEGMVQIGIMGPEADEIVLHVEPRGGCLGEPGVYSPEGDRRTDGRAFGPTTIVEVPGEKVRAVLETCPEAMRVFVRRVSQIARAHAGRVALSAFDDARSRLARLLLELADSHGVPTARGRCIELPLSQRTLAGLVGVRRERVNRLIAAWRREGALDFEDGIVTVLQERSLRSALGIEGVLS